MANKPKNSKSPFAFKPVILDQVTHQKRRVIKQLPAVHQTETLQKFFGATVDHLFDPGTAGQINGYIGQKPLWYDPNQDYYLAEPSNDRDFYQLEATMVSKGLDGSMSNLLFYPDLINQLRFQGAITTNHNRMFEQDIYTWCPPVDLDKLVNFRQYAWLPVNQLYGMNSLGLPIDVWGPTARFTADGQQFVYFLPGQTDDEDMISPADFYDLAVMKKALIRVIVNGVDADFNYKDSTKTEAGDDFITFDTPPAKGSVIQIWVYSDIENNILGKTSVHPLALGGVTLSSGMRVRFHLDKDSDYSANSVYIVEGVGDSIQLILETSSSLANTVANVPDYMVMKRGAENRNPWSRANRWFHVDTLSSDIDLAYVFAHRAARPILEFDADLELYNYGTIRRPDVDFVIDANDITPDALITMLEESPTNIMLQSVKIEVSSDEVLMTSTVVDAPGFKITKAGARVLIINTDVEDFNNKIFAITPQFNTDSNRYELDLVLEIDGLNPEGTPEVDQLVSVIRGSAKGSEYHFDGTAWILSQAKTSPNQLPLFRLHDMDGIALDDQLTYPGTTFTGSNLFAYQYVTNSSLPVDPVLNLSVSHDDKGDILFENYLATKRYQYTLGTDVSPIEGFYFHRRINHSRNISELSNDWFKAPAFSKQYVVDRFQPKAGERLFTISQIPGDGANDLQVWLGRVDDNSNFTRTLLVENKDFIRRDTKILIKDVQDQDIIEVKTFNTETPSADMPGFYEVPLCLQANPDCAEVETIGKGDFYAQFSEIISSQKGFIGAEYAVNNYRDTARDPSLGSHIVQHGAPLLKTMLLASDTRMDILRAERFVENEYSRFKDKFHQKVLAYSQSRKFSTIADPNVWIDSALREINLGKTKSFPFFNSKVGQTATSTTPSFIPATPSFLGLFPIYTPQVMTSTVQSANGPVEVSFVRGHDGSWTRALNDQCATILFALEQRIYASIPGNIRSRERPVYDAQREHGDGLRVSSYTYDEYLQLLQPSFERWVAQTGQNYRTNTTFVENNLWTYNWSGVASFDGSKLPGHWRGIYLKYYGTARPDQTPWKMFGFTDQPAWWTSRYGPGPFTSDNTLLWNDIERGFIFGGDRQGINSEWARPGLTQIIPVDEFGTLKNPYEAGIATTLPLVQEARAEWQWGDCGPVEQEWRRSVAFPFACSAAGYLMKPAQFIEFGWDSENLVKLFPGEAREQWMNSLYKARPRSAELQMHGEGVNTLEPIVRIGVQQWVADLLVSQNADVTSVLGDAVRGLGVQLAYKGAGFVDSETLVVSSDSFARVPNEDVSVNLYRSPSIREESYSGIAVEWTGEHFRVYGYDPLNPRFPVIAGDPTGSQVKIGGIGRSDLTPAWKSGVYYTVNITVAYGLKFYRCVKTHTSGSVFESEFWTEVVRPQYADGSSLLWLLDTVQPAALSAVGYGEILKTPQDVANLFNGYDRYLQSRGWVFEDVGGDSVNDWQDALKSFVVWSSNENLKPGDVITVSPGSNVIKYVAEFGSVQPVEQIVNGAYSIVDQLGKPIDDNQTVVVRSDGEITVACNSTTAGIYGLRLHISEIEHVIVFSNKTIFNDTIYNPLLNIRQPRLRIQGFRTIAWTGRVDAPGFVISSNTITPNFERAADDFRRFFDIEPMENKNLQDRARANFGYQERDYLDNLLLGPTNQFEFYQGMIQQKGSPTSMRRLLRSSFVQHNKGLQLFEEWAFRVGDYGGSETQPSMELNVVQSDFKHNPQMFEFIWNSIEENQALPAEVPGVTRITDIRSSAGAIAALDSRWTWRPDVLRITWPMRNDSSDTSRDLPTAGFVKMDEVRWFAPRTADLQNLVYNQIQAGGPLVEEGDRVWYYGIDSGSDWATYKYLNTGFGIDALHPTYDLTGTVVALDGLKAIMESGVGPVTTPTGTTNPDNFYLVLPPTYRTVNGIITPEQVVLDGINDGTDVNGNLFIPAFSGSQYVELNASKNQGIMLDIIPNAGMTISGFLIEVTEAFDEGSILKVGTDLFEEEFIKAPADGIPANEYVDLTTVGSYQFNFTSGVTSFPYTGSDARGLEVMANLFTNGVNGAVTVRIDYYYTNGFELLTLDELPITNHTGETGGQIYNWLPSVYDNAVPGTIPVGLWTTGDIVEIKTLDPQYGGNGGWGVMQWDGSSFQTIRVQNRKIDTDILTSAAIYDDRANELRMVLQPYDPAKGFIPGTADRELYYKLSIDPAVYGSSVELNDRSIWGLEQVGRLWWDLSTVRYLDYEIYDDMNGGVDYRWKNWGRIAPGANVDVYEWVRSPVSPAGYADFVSKQKSDQPVFTGYVLDPQNTPYAQRLEWNSSLNSEEVVYYFWVLNVSNVPAKIGRKMSAVQVADVIANPISNDVPYFAVIDRSRVILGGVKQFVADEDTVLKIKWKTSADADMPHHKQWKLVREYDERNTIDDVLWNKMRDSLVGWDTYKDSDGNLNPKEVPDSALPRPQQIGNLIRPRQSWFPTDVTTESGATKPWPSRSARNSLVDTLNDILSRSPVAQLWYNWADVFRASEALPDSSLYSQTALDLADMALMISPSLNSVQADDCVLIENTPELGGHWTLWKCVADENGALGFVLLDFQKWNMKEGYLWNSVDWFDTNWSPSDFPVYRFNDLQERDNSRPTDYQLLKGTLVQVDNLNDGDGIWTWYVLNAAGYTQVGRKNGTLKLSDVFYNTGRTRFTPQDANDLIARQITPETISSILAPVVANRDASMELQWLINNLGTQFIDTLQKNEIFFAMVKSAFKANRTVDWAFKTSFLYLGGYSEILRQSPVAFKDQIDNVVAYLEEVKPYHVKIREYVRRLSYGPDIANFVITDFDKPVYVEKTPAGPKPARILDPNNSTDVAILRTQLPWKYWYDNYQKTNYNPALWGPSWNPVRRMRSRILFDRVSCSVIRGWDTTPWDGALSLYSQKNPDMHTLSELSSKYRNEYLWNDATQSHYSDIAHLHQPFYFAGVNIYGDTVVNTQADRNTMFAQGLVTANNQGTIVIVREDESRWMWTGRLWLQFDAPGWDEDIATGTAGRIDRFYEPLPGMEPRGTAGLIQGCDFNGTVITSSYEDGAWDMFEWGGTGWGSELADHTGYDPDEIRDQPTDPNDSSNIVVQGEGFAQAGVGGRAAAEQMLFIGKDFLNITVTKKISGVDTPEMRFTKSQIEGWDLQNLATSAASVVDWNQTDKKLTIQVTGGDFPFYDPNNPTQEYLDKVKNMLGFYSTSSNDMTLGDKTFQLRDVDGTVVDRIPAGLTGNGIRVVLENRDAPEERMIGTVSLNSKGLEVALWEGDLHVTITGYVGTVPTDTATPRAKWNIIPLELFAPKGSIWVGQAKFTYSKVDAGTTTGEYILSDAKVDASSLAGVTVSSDFTEVSLPVNQPIYDASMMYRIVE